jgi:hypothetical protein
MFRCESCNKNVKAGERPCFFVVERRDAVYPYREGANKRDATAFDPWGTDDPGGKGYETVKELKLCEPCAVEFHSDFNNND